LNTTRRKLPARLLRNPLHCCALGFGAGLAPYAPGTAGTGVGVAVFLALGALPFEMYAATVLALFMAGIAVCGTTARALGVHDDPRIVWDEIVGYLITMTAVADGWQWWLTGFAVFRFFDIVKPWPIGYVDKRVKGGLGIMLDDGLAGLMACAVLHALMTMTGNP